MVKNRYASVLVDSAYGWGKFKMPTNARIVAVSGDNANISGISLSFDENNHYSDRFYMPMTTRTHIFNPPLAIQEGMNIFVQSSASNQKVAVLFQYDE